MKERTLRVAVGNTLLNEAVIEWNRAGSSVKCHPIHRNIGDM
jgi:hypothetical protein